MQKLPSYVVKNISPHDLVTWCFKRTKTSQSSALKSTEDAVLRSMSLLDSVAVIIFNSRFKVPRNQLAKIGNEAFLVFFFIPNKLILRHWTLSPRCNHNLQPTNTVFRSLLILMTLRRRCIAIKYNDTL